MILYKSLCVIKGQYFLYYPYRRSRSRVRIGVVRPQIQLISGVLIHKPFHFMDTCIGYITPQAWKAMISHSFYRNIIHQSLKGKQLHIEVFESLTKATESSLSTSDAYPTLGVMCWRSYRLDTGSLSTNNKTFSQLACLIVAKHEQQSLSDGKSRRSTRVKIESYSAKRGTSYDLIT